MVDEQRKVWWEAHKQVWTQSKQDHYKQDHHKHLFSAHENVFERVLNSVAEVVENLPVFVLVLHERKHMVLYFFVAIPVATIER